MKKIKYVFISIILFSILVFLTVFVFIGSSCKKTVMGRYSFSQKSSYEVVWERMDCGATTSYRDDIHILKKGENISWFTDPILRADKSDGLKVSWLAANQIEINFNSARIHKFKNYWYNQQDNDLEIINVSLKEVKK
jgi:hypothetical protein